MKISELILQLETARQRHGDLETYGSRTMFGGRFRSYSWRIENHVIVQKHQIYIIFRKMKRSERRQILSRARPPREQRD